MMVFSWNGSNCLSTYVPVRGKMYTLAFYDQRKAREVCESGQSNQYLQCQYILLAKACYIYTGTLYYSNIVSLLYISFSELVMILITLSRSACFFKPTPSRNANLYFFPRTGSNAQSRRRNIYRIR